MIFKPFGNSAILIEFDQKVDQEINAQVHAIVHAIEDGKNIALKVQ